MDLRLLRVFKAVADCGGMAAAELELNIGVSTISRHVKDLETRLRLTLCRRGRAGFALTTDGQHVYEQTLNLLSAVDAFRSGIDAIHGRLGGELELALFDKTASNPQARISQAIAQFAAQAPEVRLNVHVASLNAIERGVIDGRFHVGLIPTHRASSTLAYAELFGETMQLYAGPGHALFEAEPRGMGWAQLRAYPFAGLGYHSPNMQLSHARQLTRGATGFDQEAIALLILSGRYLGFLPDHYAASFVAAGRMRAVAPQRFHYSCRFAAIWRPSPEPGRATALFTQCLAQAHQG
ncbi:MAG: LysR family transcriptional regulator [Comamonadaceae bacterium]|nr:MAG: LysR family transcriptional regulator [Comamonadaceae bacterium]